MRRGTTLRLCHVSSWGEAEVISLWTNAWMLLSCGVGSNGAYGRCRSPYGEPALHDENPEPGVPYIRAQHVHHLPIQTCGGLQVI